MMFSNQAYEDVKIVLIMYLFVLTSRKETVVAFFPQGRSTTFGHRNAPFPMKGKSEDSTLDSTVLTAARTAGADSVCKDAGKEISGMHVYVCMHALKIASKHYGAGYKALRHPVKKKKASSDMHGEG